jgi:hypothetical protein
MQIIQHGGFVLKNLPGAQDSLLTVALNLATILQKMTYLRLRECDLEHSVPGARRLQSA